MYKLYFVQAFLQYKDSILTEISQKHTTFLLVAIKNESNQIYEFLENLQKVRQSMEVDCIIIDDHSNDLEYKETKKIVKNYDWVQLVKSKSRQGKKHALRQMFLEHKEKTFILLDADCRPNSSSWISHMVAKLKNNEIVLGYGPFNKDNSFLNKLIRFEASWIAAQYFGYSLRGIPYMGVGRNMGVKSTLYNRLDNSIKGREIQSGDDDMLVQALHSGTKVGIMTDLDTFVYSRAESNYANYLKQKRRHLSTASYYKPIHKILLGGIAISQMLFYPTLLVAFFCVNTFWLFGLLFLKWFVDWYFYRAISIRLNEHDLKNIGPIMEIIYSFHLIFLALYSFARRTIQWK